MKAYTVKGPFGLMLDCLGPHPRSAMVNYLYVYTFDRKVVPQDCWTDEFIRHLWLTKVTDAEVVMVDVAEEEAVDVSKGSIA